MEPKESSKMTSDEVIKKHRGSEKELSVKIETEIKIVGTFKLFFFDF